MSEPDLAGVAGRPCQRLHRSPAGTAPGTLTTRTGPPALMNEVRIYDGHRLEEHHGVSVEQLADLPGQWPLLRVDVRGLGDAEVIEGLGRLFRLQPLALEEVVSDHQRLKAERYPEQVFVVSPMPQLLGERAELEQLSLFLAAGAVISVQGRDGDCFDPYGMNSDPHASPCNMPELGWRFGSPVALGLMALLALGFLVFFWRRHWLGPRRWRRAAGD